MLQLNYPRRSYGNNKSSRNTHFDIKIDSTKPWKTGIDVLSSLKKQISNEPKNPKACSIKNSANSNNTKGISQKKGQVKQY